MKFLLCWFINAVAMGVAICLIALYALGGNGGGVIFTFVVSVLVSSACVTFVNRWLELKIPAAKKVSELLREVVK